jgi:hypothetical protein
MGGACLRQARCDSYGIKKKKRVNYNAKRRRTLKETKKTSIAAKPLRPQKHKYINITLWVLCVKL